MCHTHLVDVTSSLPFSAQVTVSLGARALLHCTVIGASHRTVCVAIAITLVITILIVIVFAEGVLGASR